MCVALSVLRFFSITSPHGSYTMLPTSLHRSICVRFDSMFNHVLCNLQRMIKAWPEVAGQELYFLSFGFLDQAGEVQ